MRKFGAKDAMRNHMLDGNPISILEAILLFGVPGPNRRLTELKREGYIIGSQRVPMAKIIARMNKYANVIPPAELPTREILMMEYWIKS